MKGISFSTILLAFVAVLLVISVGLISFVMFQMSKDVTAKANEFWGSKKLLLIGPTVLNVLSMTLLGVLVMMG